MKTKLKFYIILVLFFIPSLFFAQNFSGTAIYQSKISVDLDLDKDSTNVALQNPQIKEMIRQQLKQELEKKYVLNFTTKEANFFKEEKIEVETPGVQIKMFGGSTQQGMIYKNSSTNTFKSEQELLGKRFLIEDTLPSYSWEMKNETKKIGKYTCHKAIVKDEDTEITAWYTMEIPLNIGPDIYNGLPGMILEIKDGKRQFLCVSITLNPKKEIKIKIPENGKKVTSKAFEKIANKKLEEMSKMHRKKRGNSDVKIIRQ